MAKITRTPGTALSALLKKYNLNYNRLAKAIGLSSAMIRLIARDENPVSAPVAFRLAKFFKIKPEFWLALQMEYDKAVTEQDKKLAKDLKAIPTVDKATFERKPRTAKTAKKGKTTRGRKAAKPKAAPKKKVTKKAASKKTAKKAPAKKAKAPAGKRGRPAKKAVAKKAPAKKKAVAKKPPVKKAAKAPAKKPAPAPAPREEARPVTPPPQPQTTAVTPEFDMDDPLV